MQTPKIALLILFMSIGAAAHAQQNGGSVECKTMCPGGGADVIVNLAAKCMCLNKTNCFKVSIGKNGPTMTSNGTGKLGDAKGARYQTKASTSTSYDNDALAMGIPGNDKFGKWIHKTRNCAPAGNNSTKGCVAVPCDKWPEIKQMKGKTIKVCGGGSPSHGGLSSGKSGSGGGQFSGETAQ